MTIKPDPLRQLLQCLNRAATTAQVFSITEDIVYLSYSTIMSKVKVFFFEIYKRMWFCFERVV
jgi:phosphotransacetylase